ncbi:MAG: 30S ribosomal protein S17 [Candidatus Kappaea frigidicola]|nr:30S ribosomal protein S17 [Candidatus Kappaea frigidicola]
MQTKRGAKKERVGVVVSDKMDKTIVVRIERVTKHSLYNKVIKKFLKFKAHDEENKAKTGDKVKIAETRPLSKDKRWRLVEILK